MKKLTTICVALVLLGCVAPAVAARNPTRAEHAGIDRAFAHLVRHGVGCRLSYVRVSTVDPSWAAGPAHCRIPRKPLFHVVFHKSSREWRVVEWGVGPVFCNPALKAVILDALPHVCPRLEEEAREERASADHERTQAEYLASPAGACWGASHYASGEAEPEGSDAIYIGVQRAGPEYECEWVSVGAGVAWEGHLIPPPVPAEGSVWHTTGVTFWAPPNAQPLSAKPSWMEAAAVLNQRATEKTAAEEAAREAALRKAIEEERERG